MGIKCFEALNMQDRIEIVDLRSLHPIDYDTLYKSVKKCKKCLIVTEEPSENGFSRGLQGKFKKHVLKNSMHR